MQFLIIAYDGTDEKASERRLCVREKHLKGVEKNEEDGHHLYGAAILDEEGNMTGSIMIVDYPSKEALISEWLDSEPYVTENVWQKIEIKHCRVSDIFTKK